MSLLLLGCGGPGTNTGAVLAADAVAFWKLDEASGQRNDSVGSNHLTDNNTVTQAVGKVGNAAQFTRANSEYLSLADNAALSTGDIDFTIAAWVWFDTVTTGAGAGNRRPLVVKDSFGQSEYALYFEGGFGIERIVFLHQDTDQVRANTLGLPSANQWYFIVAWHDAAANTLNIQVNNGTVDSAATTVGGADRSSEFNIGRFERVGEHHDGRIDAVGFWKRTLTAAERTYLYKSGNGREYPFA